MVQTRAQSAKTRQGLASGLSEIKRDPKPFSELKPKALHSAHVLQCRAERAEIKGQRKMRARRLVQQILGSNRIFSGTVCIPSAHAARQNDKVRLSDIAAAIALGRAIVYWADGSFGGGGAKKGIMGAGVAWLEGSEYLAQSFALGHNNGTSEDAELFAIAAALGKAKKQVEKRKDIRLVRVYSDSSCVLTSLGRGQHPCFGPMISARTALQGLYERAEWLTANGAAVELVWLKGHSASQGNVRADKAATEAVKQQALLCEVKEHRDNALSQARLFTNEDVPDKWKELGQDWAEEWLYRANVPYRRNNHVNEVSDVKEEPLSPVAEDHTVEGDTSVNEGMPAIQTKSAHEEPPDFKSAGWDWRLYGVTLPKHDLQVVSQVQNAEPEPPDSRHGDFVLREHSLPFDNEIPNAERGRCDSHQNGFVLPDHDLYGNVAGREVLADLRKTFESINKDIANLERYVARKAPEKQLMSLRAELQQLDIKRDRIAEQFQAHTDRLLAHEGPMCLIKIEEP